MSEQHVCDDNEGPRVESLQVLDLIGLGIGITGATMMTVGSGLQSIASEFFSAARHRRQIEDMERFRREQGFYLEQIVEGPADG